jgi:hypothetical protein
MGGTMTLQGRVTALDGSDLTGKSTLAWSSGDEELAAVSSSGLINANTAGRTGTVEITAALGSVEGTAQVTVSGVVGSWAGTWTNISAGNSGGMWLTVQVDGSTATGEVAYSSGGVVYFRGAYEGTATVSTLRIVNARQSGGTHEIALALSGGSLTGTIVDSYPDETIHFTVSLNREGAGGTSQSITPAPSGIGPSPGRRPSG